MDGKTELTIAALIFLAGTAGLASGEDIGGVETTTELDDGSGDCTPMDFDSFNVYYKTTSTQSKCGSGDDGQKDLSVHATLPPVISLSIDEDWSFDNIPTGGGTSLATTSATTSALTKSDFLLKPTYRWETRSSIIS